MLEEGDLSVWVGGYADQRGMTEEELSGAADGAWAAPPVANMDTVDWPMGDRGHWMVGAGLGGGSKAAVGMAFEREGRRIRGRGQ